MLFNLLTLVIVAYFYAQCTQALIHFIDPKENMIFSFWGKFLDNWAISLEQLGKSVFWLKPLGLCPVCFGIWCGIIAGCVAACFSPVHPALCICVFMGACWKWAV